MTESGGGHDQVGYRKPPAATRFRKGQSGNTAGRPKGRRNQLLFETVLGQIVTVIEGGAERRVTAEQAFILKMSNEGVKGNVAAARGMREAIERRNDSGLVGSRIGTIVRRAVAPGSVSGALERLRMARKLDRYRETARMVLEPWLVEEALARVGARDLTIDEQKEVARVTRTPGKVRWPDWWRAK